MRSIYYSYSCGEVHDRLDLLIGTGTDAIVLEKSKKGFIIDLDWVNKMVREDVAFLEILLSKGSSGWFMGESEART